MRQHLRQDGLSLVELMVGLVIGLVAILMIGQIVAVFEAQKRTNTGGADAQSNGATALAVLEQEIRMAGFGLDLLSIGSANGTQVCPWGVNVYYNGAAISNPGAAPADGGLLSPVRIVDGGAGSDAIITVRSDADFSVLVNTVKTTVVPPTVTIDSALGYNKVGQLFLIAPADPTVPTPTLPALPTVCTLFQLSALPTQNGSNWDLKFNAGGNYPYNPVTPSAAFTNFPTYGAGSKVINMGYSPAPPIKNTMAYRSFVYRRYQVLPCDQQPQLRVVDVSQQAAPYTCANTDLLSDQIVSLQAQYGVATNATVGSQAVDQWVEPTGAWASGVLTRPQIDRIKAVRIGLVSRSPQYDKDVVTAAAALTVLPAIANSPPAVTYTVPDQHYRYKVFYTIVPLKNVIWGNLP